MILLDERATNWRRISISDGAPAFRQAEVERPKSSRTGVVSAVGLCSTLSKATFLYHVIVLNRKSSDSKPRAL